MFMDRIVEIVNIDSGIILNFIPPGNNRGNEVLLLKAGIVISDEMIKPYFLVIHFV
jgi:hypothetical protein